MGEVKTLKWFDYPKFESHLRFNKKGEFQRFKSNKWVNLNPSVNKGRKVKTFSTSINNEKIHCVVPNFIYEFFSGEEITKYDEIVYRDKNNDNCDFDNLLKLPVSGARDFVNRDNADKRLNDYVKSDLIDFDIVKIEWVHELKTKQSKRNDLTSFRYTSDYNKTRVLLYNRVTKLGDWVSYRTIIGKRQRKNKSDYINKIFKDKGLVPKPTNFDNNRVYETPDGYFNIYLNSDNKLYLIHELCLREKKYTKYQLAVPKIDNYDERFSISPFEIIEKLTGVELREEPHIFWKDDIIENRLIEMSNELTIMPTYTQLKNYDSALFSHFVRNGGKKRYTDLCEKLNLSFPVVFFDDFGKDFDSEDEFRIFAILKHNGYSFDRQLPYPDNTGRTLDFDIHKLCRLEFTGEVNEKAMNRINEKENDSISLGWDNFKIMKYVSNEPHNKFTERLSIVLGVTLEEPNWEYYYETYGFGIERLKEEIKKFLVNNYDGNQTQNELLKINWHLMRWAQRIWGDFANVLFQNNIEIKHRFRVTPKFLQDNLDSIIKSIINQCKYIPCYSQTFTDDKLTLQTIQFVKGLHKIYGDEFNYTGGFIYEKYKDYYKDSHKKPDWKKMIPEIIKLSSQGLSQSKIANHFNNVIEQTQVGRVLNGWRPKNYNL